MESKVEKMVLAMLGELGITHLELQDMEERRTRAEAQDKHCKRLASLPNPSYCLLPGAKVWVPHGRVDLKLSQHSLDYLAERAVSTNETWGVRSAEVREGYLATIFDGRDYTPRPIDMISLSIINAYNRIKSETLDIGIISTPNRDIVKVPDVLIRASVVPLLKDICKYYGGLSHSSVVERIIWS